MNFLCELLVIASAYGTWRLVYYGITGGWDWPHSADVDPVTGVAGEDLWDSQVLNEQENQTK